MWVIYEYLSPLILFAVISGVVAAGLLVYLAVYAVAWLVLRLRDRYWPMGDD